MKTTGTVLENNEHVVQMVLTIVVLGREVFVYW